MHKLLICLLLIFYLPPAKASVEIGVGFTSATSGRVVPALVASLTGAGWAFTGHSTGVQSELYYHSSYGANYFWTWDSGLLMGGKVTSGFGVGGFFAQREFADTGGADVESESDFGLGPGFRVNWSAMGPVYLNLEAVYGLRDLYRHLTLNAQDHVNFSMGVRF